MQNAVTQIFDSSLPARARLIALELVSFAGDDAALPLGRIASTGLLADRTGMSVRTIQTHLPALVAAGVVVNAPTVFRSLNPEPEPELPAALRAFVIARDGCCVRCGSTVDLTVDHIWPRARGGDDELDNLRTLCRSCNSSKGARVGGP